MRVAGLIPARVNSRRLPDKNWREVGGLPLWKHAVVHALGSTVCDVVAISTDCERILGSVCSPLAFARRAAVELIVQPRFEQTYNVMLQVVCHADDELCRRGHDMDAIVLLQPTSPLRSPQDVRACVEMLTPSVDSVVSMTDGHDDIAFAVRHAGRLEKLPKVVVPNGAVYAVKTSVLREGGGWYGDFAHAYMMPKERSIDIDNEMDLEMAQAAWERLSSGASV
jgi:CMP-N,N'-diacetyllegionaminic acid synthase